MFYVIQTVFGIVVSSNIFVGDRVDKKTAGIINIIMFVEFFTFLAIGCYISVFFDISERGYVLSHLCYIIPIIVTLFVCSRLK